MNHIFDSCTNVYKCTILPFFDVYDVEELLDLTINNRFSWDLYFMSAIGCSC